MDTADTLMPRQKQTFQLSENFNNENQKTD